VTMVAVAGLLVRGLLTTLYAGTVVNHTILQRRFARQHAQRPVTPPEPAANPTVDVILPVWNEAPELLRACCESLLQQDYKNLNVFLIDDLSGNLDALRPLYDHYASMAGWRVITMDWHVGKREAQNAAYQIGTGEFVLTIDSDTVIFRDTIQKLLDQVEHDRVGAVTGNVRILNHEATWLTRLINWRYGLLFDQERAAHGLHRAVLCCTGPLSLYRRQALDEIWRAYLDQTFMNQPCVFGDDLQLTNLLLARGKEARYAAEARALTNAPTTLGAYFRQQVRWNRSFYRELPWTGQALLGHRLVEGGREQGRKASLYLWFDVIARGLMPLLLAAGLLLGGMDAALARSWLALALDAGMIAVMLGSSGLAALWQTRSLPDAPSPRKALRMTFAYGLVHVGMLIPARVWALLTLRKNSWGTRQEAPVAEGQRSATSPVEICLAAAELPFSS